MSESRPPSWPAAGGSEPEEAEPTGVYPTEQDPTNAQPLWQDPTYAQPQYPQQSWQDPTYTQPQYAQQPQYAPQQHGYWPPGPDPTQQAYAQQQAYTQQQAYAYQNAYAYQQAHAQQQAYTHPQWYGYPPAYPYGYGAATGAPPRRRSFGFVAAVLTVIGGVILVVSFTATTWTNIGGAHTSFSMIRNSGLLTGPNAPGLPYAYFNWLAWLLFAVVVAFGLAGALPTPIHVPFRVFGALAGVAGIVFTYFAYERLLAAASHYTLGYRDSLQGASVGFYMALGGFLVAAIGAATGPHRTIKARR
jgi:hypothetical protein